jgi:TPR repeat protein
VIDAPGWLDGRGDGTATFNYASMLWLGEGGPKDEAGAMRWMRKASREGSTDADVFLADVSGFWSKPGTVAARRAAAAYARAALRGDIRGLRGLVDLTEFGSGRFVEAIRKGIDAGLFSK